MYWAEWFDRQVGLALTNKIDDEPGNEKEVDVAANPKDDQAIGDEDDEHPKHLVQPLREKLLHPKLHYHIIHPGRQRDNSNIRCIYANLQS